MTTRGGMTTGAAGGASKPVPSDTPPGPSQIGGPVFKHMSLWVGGISIQTTTE